MFQSRGVALLSKKREEEEEEGGKKEKEKKSKFNLDAGECMYKLLIGKLLIG